MSSSAEEMTGGSVNELQQLLAETSQVEFMKVEKRETSTEMELVGYKDVNNKTGDDLPAGDKLKPIKMPFASKMYDVEVESGDTLKQKLARILHKGESFREAQHNKNERQARTTDKMEKSSQDIMILAVPALAPAPPSTKMENDTNQNETDNFTVDEQNDKPEGLIVAIKGWVEMIKYCF